MREENTQQRTQKWFEERCGCLTASVAGRVLKRTRNGWSTARAEEMTRIMCERITNKMTPTYTNAAMEWGTATEPLAKEAYEMASGNIVTDCGFIHHPSIDFFGASPDGFVGEDGLIEIKCPNTTTHLERIATREIPQHYKIQMQVQMLCTGRTWCDFVDYDPRLTGRFENYQLLIIRYTPTKSELDETLEGCLEFLKETEDALTALLGKLKLEEGENECRPLTA